MTEMRTVVLGCSIDRLNIEETVARCDQLIRSRVGAHHISVNAPKLVALRDDPRLHEIVSRSDLVSADGQPVVWASRLLGNPLPERVTGIDLMERLLLLAEQKAYRVFILGARPEVLARAVERLRERYPRLELVGYRDGWFDDTESSAVCAEIRSTRPEILFVAMSSPRKEYWVADHLDELDVPLSMGVGGAIDVVAGVTRRAPRWMQRTGLEWLYRLIQEPRRLGRRYVITSMKFGFLLGAELLTRKRTNAAR
jgi:N-acetylglucosaminyldiphosphoundecaprenol N-acetyl-beta-D-mannosaminyltransferase